MRSICRSASRDRSCSLPIGQGRTQSAGRSRSTATPAPAAWKTIVPEQQQAIESVAFIGGRVVAQYLVDVQSRLRLFGLDGAEQGDIALPGIGTVGALSGREDTPDVWYSVHVAARAVHGLSLRPGHEEEHAVRAAAVADRSKRLRDQGDVRHVEGRHQGAVLPDREEGTARSTATTRR